LKFLDAKEEVLDIELTQYGKRLLSKGVFKPEYYAFYDDDIIYDVAWASSTEDQNESQDRILEMPRPGVQYNFSGVETTINQKEFINDTGVGSAEMFQNEADKNFQIAPLGTADPFSENMPSWDVKFYESKMTSAAVATYKTDSVSLKITQIPVELTQDVKISISDKIMSEDMSPFELEGMSPDDDHLGYRFPDNTYHFLDDSRSNLFAKILEKNTTFENDNFEIEVYKISPDDELERLYFLNDSNIYVKDGILLDEPEKVDIKDFGPKYVEYYFDLLVDSEIPDETYCKAISKNVLEDIYSDKELFNCEDLEDQDKFSDIYKISKESDGEPC
tara:strand:+ start:2266 stop:3264 length:999 start_codon:yes stop_codon:yes gene_type:complete